MNADEIRVNLQAMEDFRDRLAPRLRETAAVVSRMSRTDEPPLGAFHHARQTAHRYEALHTEFMARVRRLLTAVVVVEAGTRAILASYDTDRGVSQARLDAVTDMLRHGDRTLFAAAVREAGLDEALFRDPALFPATLRTEPVVGDGHVNG